MGPSRRKTTRTPSSQPQPAPIPQSDYDTDAANATDTGGIAAGTAAIIAATTSPPPQRTNTELNLSVLRRYQPDILSIVAIAPFAVVYQFTPETQAWEKIGVEGTGFVCQLAGYAQYTLIILNRKGLDNLYIELDRVDAEDIEVTEEYIILPVVDCESATPVVYGLWVFSEEEGGAVASTRDVIAGVIVECAQRAGLAKAKGFGNETQFSTNNGADGKIVQSHHGHVAGADTRFTQSTSAGQQIDLASLFNTGPSSGASPFPNTLHPAAGGDSYYQSISTYNPHASQPAQPYGMRTLHEASLLGLLQGNSRG